MTAEFIAARRALSDISVGVSLPYEGDFRVDPSVLAKFSEGTKVRFASRYGASAWTVTARIYLEMPGGSEERYFLKSAPLALGRMMMEGEFHSMSEFYKYGPDLVPKPHSWGRYVSEDPEAYFFLLEYIEMVDMMPDPNKLCATLARVHRDSQSPTGQFGFPVTTCQNLYPQDVSWDSNWTRFFTNLMRQAISMDWKNNGIWEELDQLEQRLLALVVPRLLDALVQNGRVVKPSLLHADLWEGNTGTSLDNGTVYTFDTAAFYGHNEMDVADWRGYYNKISNKAYIRTYLQHYPPSEPRQEWDDRNRLYACYYYVWYSVHHKAAGKGIRQMAYNDMYYLIQKFAPFPEGTGPRTLDPSEMHTLSPDRDNTLHTKLRPENVSDAYVPPLVD